MWLLKVGVPINLEVVGEIPRGLKKDAQLDLELCFLFLKGDFYKDEAEYYREKNSRMAAESYIPCGTFSPTMDPNFVESTTALINGEVAYVERVMVDGEAVCKIELRCEEFIFRVVCPDYFDELGIHEGTILSGLFTIDGRISRR